MEEWDPPKDKNFARVCLVSTPSDGILVDKSKVKGYYPA